MRTAQKGLTVRSVVVGLAVVMFVDTWATYAEMRVQASRMTLAHFPLALFATFLLLLALNRGLARVRLRALSPAEMLVVLSMGLVGAVIPVEGVVGFLLGIISSLYYFASPENLWAEFYHPYLAQWLIPQGSAGIWTQFFEGSLGDAVIPWGMWAPPLFWWATFILGTLWVSACGMVVLRKQWVASERLVFPLASVAIRLVDPEAVGRQPLMRSRLFWVGVSIPFLLLCWEAVSWFYAGSLPLTRMFFYRTFRFSRYSTDVVVNPFQFFSMGFGYFANVDVLFSIWFFFLIHVVEGAVFNRFGYGLTGAGSDQFSGIPPSMGWQGFGALCFLVLWGLWVARRHLRDVFRKAFRGDDTVDDSGEMLSYRTAVWGGLLGLLYLFFWLHQSGMAYTEAGLFLFASFIIYVGMARIVSETGVLYTWGTVSPQSFVVNVLGSNAIAGSGMTAILLSYSLINYLRGLFMPALAHVVWFGDFIGGRRRQLLAAVAAGAGIGLVFTLWYTLGLCYDNGAYNTFGWPRFFNGNPKGIFSNTLSKMRNPFPTDWPRLLFAGAGAVVMGGLTFLRSRLAWWRLHPIGFAMSAMINTRALAIPVFFAWAVKSILLSVGGVQMYRRSMPFFVGLIVGYVLGVSLCSGVDMVWFPGQGHRVHDW